MTRFFQLYFKNSGSSQYFYPRNNTAQLSMEKGIKRMVYHLVPEKSISGLSDFLKKSIYIPQHLKKIKMSFQGFLTS